MLANRYVRLVEQWNDFWTWVNENQLAATVIGTLIASGLLWLLSRLPKVGPPVTRFLSWLWSWRPVSARRHEKELTALQTALTLKQERLSSEFAAHKKKTDESARIMTTIAKEAHDRSLGGGFDLQAALTRTKTSTEPPLPVPRWSVYATIEEGDGKDFILRNMVPRSVAKEVHLESDNDFEFLDAGHWEELSGISNGEFRGEVSARGWAYGVNFTVEWYDENNEKRSTSVRLQGHPEDVMAYEEMRDAPY